MNAKKLKVLIIGAIVTGIIGLGFDTIKGWIARQNPSGAMPVIIMTPTPSQQYRTDTSINTPSAIMTPVQVSNPVSSDNSSSVLKVINYLKASSNTDLASKALIARYKLDIDQVQTFAGSLPWESGNGSCSNNKPDPYNPGYCIYDDPPDTGIIAYVIDATGALVNDKHYSGLIITTIRPQSIKSGGLICLLNDMNEEDVAKAIVGRLYGKHLPVAIITNS